MEVRRIKIPLSLKYAILIILLSTIPLIFVGIRTININQIALQTATLELHNKIVNSFAERIVLSLREITNIVPYITNTLSTSNISWEDRESMLKTILDSHDYIISISIVDINGYEKFKVYKPIFEEKTKLLNFKNNPAFIQIVSKKNLLKSIGKLYYIKDFPCIDLFYKVVNNPSIIIHINITVKPIFDEIKNFKIGKTGYVFLVNHDGRVINYTEKRHLFENIKNTKIFKQALNTISTGSSEYIDTDGKSVVGSYTQIRELNWIVIAQQERNEAYYSSRMIKIQALYLLILSTILAIITGFYISHNLSKPILQLIHAAGEIAKRNFSVRVTTKTHDEIDDLINTFNLMASELKRYDDMQIDKLLIEKTKTEAIIFSIADGMIMTDYEGRILLVNKQAQNIFGIKLKQQENQFLWDYIKDENLIACIKEVVEKPGEVIKEINLSDSIHSKYYQLSATPVKTLKNENLGVVTVIRDITLEKEIARIKDDFLHSITHDLRNPMTSIRGFLKFLADGVGGPLNEQQKKMVETMDRASLRLLGMINDILDLAKLEAGRMQIILTSTNIPEITNKVIELLQPQIVKKNITVNIIKINEIPPINSDSNLIERVFNNLLGNAIKFTPENGMITVTMEDMPDRIQISIKDTGEGIPEEYITKIFDKFGQVASQRKGGTGLGLTICKYIIEAHKGRIWVESELGKGSNFKFYIPKGLSLSENGEIICSKEISVSS